MKIYNVFLCCIISIVLYTPQSFAQNHKNVDLGILLGTAQYNGDINMTKAYYSPQPAIALIFKRNYNPHYALKINATVANLKADDKDFSNTYQQERNYYFDNTRIIEFSAGVEFNFFEVTNEKKIHKFSPFVSFSLGAMYMENAKIYEILTIPMGLGVKYRILPKLELRCDWTFRKTFNDKLDQLADAPLDGYQQYKQISFNKTNDWFSILGVSLLYNFSKDKIPCHIYEQRTYNTKKRRR